MARTLHRNHGPTRDAVGTLRHGIAAWRSALSHHWPSPPSSPRLPHLRQTGRDRSETLRRVNSIALEVRKVVDEVGGWLRRR